MSKRIVVATSCVIAVGGLIALVAADSQPGSPSRLISCIKKRGWHRQTRPFTIRNLRHMHLAFDWSGGPGSYVDVVSFTRGKPFELVAVSEKLGVADEARLLHEVQSSPGNFEAVLVANDPHEGRSQEAGSDVVSCSFEVYPKRGP